MEQNYLCFQAKVTLFLIPLETVYHILPGRQNVQVTAVNFARLWDPDAPFVGKYTILLKEGESSVGILTDEIFGVLELSRAPRLALPPSVRSRGNSFIRSAVYLEQMASWAFLVDPQVVCDRCFENIELTDRMEPQNEAEPQNEEVPQSEVVPQNNMETSHSMELQNNVEPSHSMEPQNGITGSEDTNGNRPLSLRLGDLAEEVSFSQVVKILSSPQILWVPAALPHIVGILPFGGSFVAVRYPLEKVSDAAYSCVVVIREEDGRLCGIAADHIIGGEQLDSLY